MSLSDKKDSECCCCQTCSDTIKRYKELLEEMTRKTEDLSYARYEMSKTVKPLKAKLEATTKDFNRIAEENSVNRCWLRSEKEKTAKLTAELEALKEKYKENEFSIKKFDASRAAVEVLIDEQNRFQNQDKDKKGIGYNEVPPPWNDNYTSPLETKESDEPMQYGKPTAAVAPTAGKQEDCASTRKSKSDDVDTNVSSSCAGESLDEGQKQDNMSPKSNDSVPVSSSTCVVEPGSVAKTDVRKPKPRKSAKQTDKCACSGACGSFFLKKQTCFNCGIPGHIARNCPHRPYVPYYTQGWQNVPRGRSYKRNPSRSHSRDGNWNDAKAKRQKARDKMDGTPDSRDAFTRPHWVRSKSSQGSSSSSHLRNKPKAKGRPNSKSSAGASTRSNHQFFKPNYRWVPKGSMPKTNKDPVNSELHSLSNKQDMSWESVPIIDSNGKPSVKMDWVPKTV